MEGAEKVHPDNTEELWFRKEELRGTHAGGGLPPQPGDTRGERWVYFLGQVLETVAHSFTEQILPVVSTYMPVLCPAVC